MLLQLPELISLWLTYLPFSLISADIEYCLLLSTETYI